VEAIEDIFENLEARASEALTRSECRTPEACLRWLEKVEHLLLRDPRSALVPAEVGLRLAASIPPDRAPRREREVLKAKALGVLGGVERTLGRFDRAEATYLLAAEILIVDGDALEGADLSRRLATLRREQQRFEEALDLAREAVACYRHHGEERLLGQALTDLGNVLSCERRDLGGAIASFREALQYLDPKRDSIYYRYTVHNLATALCVSDDESLSAELAHWFERSRRLDCFEPGSPGAFKARWLEGLVHRRRRESEHARAALRDALDGFLELELAGEAAATAMDLARLHLECGHAFDARRLAGELFPIFQALRAERDVTEALSLYVNAAMLDRLSLELVGRVRGVLEERGWSPAY